MTKKRVKPRTGGPKPQKPASSKLPNPKPSNINKPTPALTTDSTEVVRPLQPPVTSKENNPLIDFDYRIVDTTLEFDLLEVHSWFHEKI